MSTEHGKKMKKIYPNRLRIEELVTDPPKGAEICDDCQGWGVECKTCNGLGWTIPTDFDLAERAGQERLFDLSPYYKKWWQ